MDKFDELVAEARAELATIEAEIALLKTKLAVSLARVGALEQAGELLRMPADDIRPPERRATSANPIAGFPPRRSGRQQGSITQAWKVILVRWYESDPEKHGFDYAAIQSIAKYAGVDTTLHSVRDRIRKYRDRLGIIEETNGKFRVTEDAYKRYKRELDARPRRTIYPPVAPVVGTGGGRESSD